MWSEKWSMPFQKRRQSRSLGLMSKFKPHKLPPFLYDIAWKMNAEAYAFLSAWTPTCHFIQTVFNVNYGLFEKSKFKWRVIKPCCYVPSSPFKLTDSNRVFKIDEMCKDGLLSPDHTISFHGQMEISSEVFCVIVNTLSTIMHWLSEVMNQDLFYN